MVARLPGLTFHLSQVSVNSHPLPSAAKLSCHSKNARTANTYTLYRAQPAATVVNSRKLLLTAPVQVSETLVARNPHVRCSAFSTYLVPGQHTSGYLHLAPSGCCCRRRIYFGVFTTFRLKVFISFYDFLQIRQARVILLAYFLGLLACPVLRIRSVAQNVLLPPWRVVLIYTLASVLGGVAFSAPGHERMLHKNTLLITILHKPSTNFCIHA